MPLREPRILEKTYTVTDAEAIHFMGSEVTPVLSTPSLVNWMELTSRENAAALLGPGEDTVGVSMQIKHLAPTPVGMKARVVSNLQSIDGKTYTFSVEAFDEIERIAAATHQRAAITVAKFAARVGLKRDKASPAR